MEHVFPISELTKGITLEITVSGVKTFKARCFIGCQLIRIIGCKCAVAFS